MVLSFLSSVIVFSSFLRTNTRSHRSDGKIYSVSKRNIKHDLQEFSISSNGDRWFLGKREADGKPFVLHWGNGYSVAMRPKPLLRTSSMRAHLVLSERRFFRSSVWRTTKTTKDRRATPRWPNKSCPRGGVFLGDGMYGALDTRDSRGQVSRLEIGNPDWIFPRKMFGCRGTCWYAIRCRS